MQEVEVAAQAAYTKGQQQFPTNGMFLRTIAETGGGARV
jgi:hypothetical protein